MPQTAKLVQIRIYPVKSLRGFDRDVWELDPWGLRYDRRWMVVDPDGHSMTQRDHPGMAEIAVELQADRLILTAPMRSPVEVPLEPEPGASEPVTIRGDTVAARAVSEDANRWLGEVLLTPCRLVYMPEESVRAVESGYVEHDAHIAFTDGFPLLLASEESLAELNRRLPDPVTMDRFRPNLVVQGVGEPHAEDAWRRIRISGTEILVVKPCSRCVITTTDQRTGERGKEPLRTLATYRTADGEVWFGQNAVHRGRGRLRVGDDVEILETGEPRPVPEAEKPAAAAEPASAAEPTSAVEPTPAAEPAPAAESALPPDIKFPFEEEVPDEPEEVEVSGKEAAPADVRYVLGERPETATIEALYRTADRAETTGDQDPGRFERTFAASNVVVAAWIDDRLVGVMRAWTDGARDGFISDLVVHPDHVGAGISVGLVQHAMEAHPGIRWVLRSSSTSPYLGSALAWTHMGGGWFVSPG